MNQKCWMSPVANAFIVVGLAGAAMAPVAGAGCSFSANAIGLQEPPPPSPDARPPSHDLVDRPCTNLRCQQTTCSNGSCAVAACAAGATTTVTGTVTDPAGKVPLSGVTVYVPNAPVSELSEGAACDCATSVSGDPIQATFATTDAKGQFTMTDVPVGNDIPVVVQVGKWRRVATLPAVARCTSTAADPELTRLPRTRDEGHIPKIALTTGGADALECLLRKIGIADGEFTPESGPGRINLFAGGTHNGAAMANTSAGTNAYAGTLNGGAPFTAAETWWESGDNVDKYDLVLHSCEGVPDTKDTNKSVNARQALQAYADKGGRVFASHWHNYWIEHGPAPWPTVAKFNHQSDPKSPFTSTIDTSFAKGAALSAWLDNLGATPTPGQLLIEGAKHTVDAANAPSQRWIYSATPTSVQYFSFETPVAAALGQQPTCGKVVFSDLHVSAGSGASTDDKSSPALPFPTGCMTTDLSPQEKTLEFMLFDLSTCTVLIR